MGSAHSVPFTAPPMSPSADFGALHERAQSILALQDVDQNPLFVNLTLEELGLGKEDRELDMKQRGLGLLLAQVLGRQKDGFMSSAARWIMDRPPAKKTAEAVFSSIIELRSGNKALARKHLAAARDLLQGRKMNPKALQELGFKDQTELEIELRSIERSAKSTKLSSACVVHLQELIVLAKAALDHKTSSRATLRDRANKLRKAVAPIPPRAQLAQEARVQELRLCWQYLLRGPLEKPEADYYGRRCLELLETCTMHEDLTHVWELGREDEPRGAFELCHELRRTVFSTGLTTGQLQQGIRLTTNASIRAHLCIIAAEKFVHELVRQRGEKNFVRATAAAEQALRLLRDPSIEAVGLCSVAHEHRDSVEEDLEFVRAQRLVAQGERLLDQGIINSENIQVELLWDAIDILKTVPEKIVEEHAAAMGGVATAFKALGLFDYATKYAAMSINEALGCFQNLTNTPWYKRCREILEERDRRNDAAAREKERRQAEQDAPILKELESELEAIGKAAEASWADLIQHIYKAHPVKGREVPSDLSPDNQKKALRQALLAFHVDKVGSSASRKQVLLHERITRHLNHFFNNCKGF